MPNASCFLCTSRVNRTTKKRLSRGLMKPYNFEGATEEQEWFNYRLSSTRMVIECLFGQLKSRFRCLLRGLQFRSVNASCKMITACVLLHNFIIAASEDNDAVYFDDTLLDSEDLDDWINRNPNDDDHDQEEDLDTLEDPVTLDSAGEVKRDIICSMLWRKRLQ